MFNKIWDAETVIAAIHGEILAGHDVSYYATFKRVPSLLRAGLRTFGSWRNAIEAVGLNYDDIKKYRTWSEERVIATIRAHVDEGHDLSWRNVALNLDPSLAAAAMNYFNDWHHALTEAGLNPEQIAKYQRWSLEKIENELHQRSDNGNGVLYSSFLEDDRNLIDAVYRRVESFADFRNSVVGKPVVISEKIIKNDIDSKPKPREHWNAEKVIIAIKQRVDNDESLSYIDIKTDNRPLLRAGERYYGKWEKAVIEAGYNYESIKSQKHCNFNKKIDDGLHLKEGDEKSVTSNTSKIKTQFKSLDELPIDSGTDVETDRGKWTMGKVIMKLNILREDGVELKAVVIKKHAPDLLAAVYYHIGSLKEARKMLEEINLTPIKSEKRPVNNLRCETEIIKPDNEGNLHTDDLVLI